MARRRRPRPPTSSAAKPGAKKAARKRPIAPATREEEALADARHVADRMKYHFSAVQKADAKRKVKLFPKAALAAYQALIRQASTAIGGHTLKRDTTRGATARVHKLRLALHALVVAARDEIALAYPDDKDIQHAFGVGKRLSKKINQDVIAVATEQQQAWEDAKFGPKARAAGISKARIDATIAARRALSDAGTEKSASSGAQAGGALGKKGLVRDLKKTTTRARKVAKAALRGDVVALAEFKPGARRKNKKPPGDGSGGGSGGP